MSWLALDSKGDLARNYGTIAKKCYGYNVSVIDLRNPTRSDGNNLLTLVNRYANREDLERNLPQSNKAENADMRGAYAVSGRGGIAHEPAVWTFHHIHTPYTVADLQFL